jgi:hypothetical protein
MAKIAKTSSKNLGMRPHADKRKGQVLQPIQLSVDLQSLRRLASVVFLSCPAWAHE